MDAFQAQQQIRNNATEISDYLSDLKSWGKDMERKEKKAKQKKKDKKKKTDDLPPIRNQKKAANELKKNEQVASSLKCEGNDYFKSGQYKLAIISYTKAIESTPFNAVLYSNRAIAKLKNDDFNGAELDCNKCIEIDSSQIKAWFRRGLARKSLKKYNKSLIDFERVLELDPNNKAAQKQKTEIKNKLQSMYKKSKQQKYVKQDDKMRKIVIEECCDSDSDSSSDQKDDNVIKKKKSVEIKEELQTKSVDINIKDIERFEIDKIPTNFIEFEKIWNRAKINKHRSMILMALKNKRIDKIIKNMIDDTLFSEMIESIHYISTQNDINDGLILLKQLTKLDRFEMIVMFMNETEQKLLKQIKQKCVEKELDIAVFDKFE